MSERLIILLILEIIAIILITFGYLIKFKGSIQLIAGVCKNDDKIKDKKGFGTFVGGNILVMGMIFCIGPVIFYFYAESKIIIETILLLSLLIIGVITYIGSKKYLQSD